MPDLTDKIQKLKEIHLGSHAEAKLQIEAWEKETARLMQLKEYAENKITLRLTNELQRRVEQIEIILKTDRNLNDGERVKLFERLDSYMWFLKMFNPKLIDDRIDSLNQAVDYELPQPKK